MKALLIIMILPVSDAGHTTVTPMVSMESCQSAVVAVHKRRDDLHIRNSWIQALCVENK